jgi:AcrR family transcriptional regulator
LPARPDGAKTPRVRLDHAERKRQLTAACAHLIATKGYSHTSVRDVARHVGISTGTLLHHFPTKEDLLVGTLQHVGAEFLVDMEHAVDGGGAAPVKLRSFTRAVLETPRHDVGWRVWIAFWHEASINSEIAPAAYGQSALTEDLLTRVIEAGQRAGQLRVADPAMSAIEMLVLIEGCAVRLFGEPGRLMHGQAIAMVDQLVGDWSAENAA